MPSTIGIISSSVNQADWDTVISADAPYGWWKLNESSGNLVQSGSVGGSSTAYSDVTGLTRSQTGLAPYSGNAAFSFSSTATTWNRQNVTNFGTNLGSNNAVSFEIICKITNSAGRATLGRQRADALGWGLILTTNGTTLNATGWFGNIFDKGIDINTGVTWTANKWFHVVYTYAPTQACLYVNGSLIQSKSYTVNTYSDSSNNCDLFSSFSGSYDRSRYSTIDEMCIYKSTLSASQVANHALASGVLSNY